MGNGNIDKVEAKLEALNADIARNREVRDGQFAAWREDHQRDIAEISNLLSELATKVAAAEKQSERAPTWLQIVIAAGTLASILAGLATFTLEMTVAPIEKEEGRHQRVHETLRSDLAHYQADVTGMVKVVQDRQDDVRTRLARIEGQLPLIERRLDDVDKLGSRKWVKQGE
jgi:chromosome segregation ATPase